MLCLVAKKFDKKCNDKKIEKGKRKEKIKKNKK